MTKKNDTESSWWAADITAPVGMHLLHQDMISQTGLKLTQVATYPIYYFPYTSLNVLFLGFRYFKL